MIVGMALEKMIHFYDGSLREIDHFLTVYAFAKTIGEQERLDAETRLTLELAAIVHDIACPLCRLKYGSAEATLQEREGPALAREFFEGLPVSQPMVERICWLVGHHHTYADVDGADHQILLEADFLVNAAKLPSPEAVLQRMNAFFKTATGVRLLRSAYKLP